MDVEALRTFIAVHRERGFSSAAEVLGRSQPAISRRISLLEDALRAPLFERVAGGVVLSQAGRVLLPYAERAVAAMQDAQQAVRALSADATGPLDLAVVGTLAGSRPPEILTPLGAQHPKIDLSLRTATSVAVSDFVRRGEATIGLRYDRDGAADLQCEKLADEPMVVVCAREHRLAGRPITRLAALRDERWIAFPEVPGQREITAAHIQALFLVRGMADIPWTPVDSLTAQKRLVEGGFGLAVMPRSYIEEELVAGTISTIAVGDLRATTPIVAVTRRGGYLSMAARALLALLRQHYAAAGRTGRAPRK
jgi:DNA-binding transcriptional LysR family regulator